MTAEEAIKVIETNFCDECIMTSCENCAQGKAKEALEKQIPKELEVLDKVCDEIRNCPVCGDLTIYRGKEFYCKCGQKVTWN